jgi:hypothetical protein
MLSSKFGKKETMIHMHGFDIMLLSWGSLQRVEDDGFCVCFLHQRKRLQSLCPCCLKLTTSHYHHHHHHQQEVLFSHSLTHWTHTELNWTVSLWEGKRDLRGFQKLIKTVCLLVE